MPDLNVTAELEVDDGTGHSRQFSVDDLHVDQTGAAKDSTLTAGLGTDGATPPTITGTGLRGWLRAIYEKLSSGLTVTVTNPGGSTDVSTLATSAGQTAQGTKLDTLHTDVAAVTTSLGTDGSSAPALPGSASGVRGWLRAIYSALTGTLTTNATVSNFPATQAVSAAALPLPAGAGTAANQASILAKLGTTLLVESSSASKGNGKLTLAGASALLSSISGGIPSGATRAIIQPVSAVNINDDGTTADATDYLLAAGQEWVYDGDKLSAVRLFGSGDVYVWFYA